MNEMIERVAKALCAAADYPIEADVLARAAIEAMREPTPEMIQARIDSYPAELRIRQSDLEVYRAMLTAALA